MASHRQITYKCSTCSKEFRQKSQLIRHGQQAHGHTGRSSSPRPVMKTRAAFYLATALAARAARQLANSSLNCRRLARKPFALLNIAQIKSECKNERRAPVFFSSCNSIPLLNLNVLSKQVPLNWLMVNYPSCVRSGHHHRLN